jgi:tRNA threonylcarbamoyl adenosine modification protein YjeE
MQGLVTLGSEADCAAWAQCWGQCLERWVRTNGWGWRVFLEGELGVGKTFFVQKLLHALGVPERVKSPSFNLLNTYPLKCGLVAHHFDFYRLTHPRDWLGSGLEPCFEGPDMVLVEWPQRAWLPAPDWHLHWSFQDTVDDFPAARPAPRCKDSARRFAQGAPHNPLPGLMPRQVRISAGQRLLGGALNGFEALLELPRAMSSHPWQSGAT